MPLPSSINQADLDLIASKKAAKKEQIAQADTQVADTQAQIEAAEAEEVTNKKMFDFYHGMVGSYESERRSLSGTYTQSPLVESDIVQRSQNAGRLYDVAVTDPDVVRIPQFDGSPTGTDAVYEVNRIPLYTDPLSRLTNGLSTTTAYTQLTTTALSAGPVGTVAALRVVTNAGMSSGKEVMIHGSGRSVLCTVTSVSTGGTCSLPAYTSQSTCTANMGTWTPFYVLNVTYLTTLGGSIGSGATVLGTWNGYTNSERTSKTASVSAQQEVMDYYVGVINDVLDEQISKISSQVSAISSNEDPNMAADALSVAQSHLAQYQAYRATTDVSDTGVSTLTALNATRTTRNSTRLSEINGALTPLYDSRYEWTRERCGFNGSLSTAFMLQGNISSIQEQKGRNQGSVGLYNSDFS